MFDYRKHAKKVPSTKAIDNTPKYVAYGINTESSCFMAGEQTDKSVNHPCGYVCQTKSPMKKVVLEHGYYYKSRTPAWIYKEVVQAFIKQGLFFVVKPCIVQELAEIVHFHGYKNGFRVKYIRRFVDSDAVEVNMEFRSHGGARSTLLKQFKHGRNYDGAY